MATGRSPLFSLIICFLVCSSDALEIIEAEVGQDVILPCKVPNNINITSAVWRRSDQDPEYVLVYRGRRIDPDHQHPSYQNRVDLQDKDMKDGDVSLILKNVKMEDTGRYECLVFEKGKNKLINITYLKSHLSAQKMTGVEKITADVGQNVILPCKDPKNNKTITAVEWIRPDLEPEYVLFYKHGRIDPDNQHPSYQNRVDLQDKEMKDGNASLNLKNVTKNDTGTYMCWVFQKGKNDLINIINLEVHLSDHSWKTSTIIGVVVVIILLILALGFVVYKKLQNRKRKILFNALQEVIQRLERNNPEINNQLQQEEQENENLENEQEELMGNNPEINNPHQQEEQENENLENEQEELDELNSDTNSDPTGSDEENQQEEGVPLAAGVHE